MTQATPTLWWSNYVDQVSNLMEIQSTSSNFQTMLPGMIDYAEQRIWREMDPLRQQVGDSATSVSSGVRTVTLSTLSGVFITLDQVNILSSNSSTRYPTTPVSREVMDAIYPSGSNVTGIPQFYAMASDTVALLGPAPDQAYPIEYIGIQRPTPLSSINSSTFLTQYCPELFVAASMVFAFGYMRDFGGQSDNPQAAQSWETQYKTLFPSALQEAMRAKQLARPPPPAVVGR
jgi:hypothetical protein